MSLDDVDIHYLVFVFDAEEFSTMVAESSLFSHVQKAQLLYPGYTICYVVNRLAAFLKKKYVIYFSHWFVIHNPFNSLRYTSEFWDYRDQDKYQAPHDSVNIRWQRPPVEKVSFLQFIYFRMSVNNLYLNVKT